MSAKNHLGFLSVGIGMLLLRLAAVRWAFLPTAATGPTAALWISCMGWAQISWGCAGLLRRFWHAAWRADPPGTARADGGAD